MRWYDEWLQKAHSNKGEVGRGIVKREIRIILEEADCYWWLMNIYINIYVECGVAKGGLRLTF